MRKFRDSIAGSIIILAVICFVVTGALAATYKVTQAAILEQQGGTEGTGDAGGGLTSPDLMAALPDADSFSVLDVELPEGVTKAYMANNNVGFAFESEGKGYGGQIPFTIGVDTNGAVTGIVAGANGETVGIGSAALEDTHLSRYIGQNSAEAVDAMSGATATSTGVKSGVEAALAAFAALPADVESHIVSEGGGGGGNAPAVLLAVLPDADSFTDIADALPEGVSKGYSADNGAGFVFELEAKGYGGVVQFTIGVGADGAITGIVAGDNGETVGIGTVALEEAHLNKYIGQNSADAVDAMSGATTTSTGVKTGAELALEAYSQVA